MAGDLEGKIDDKKPHVMDTSEFFHVTKSKVGYRLREVLSGKSKMVRDKSQDNKLVRAYLFDREKLRRVAKKYGYDLVSEFQSLMTSQRAQASDSTSNNVENDVESQGNNVEKSLGAPKELVKLRNSDTKPKSIEEMLPSTCWICGKALPLDNAYCTTLEGKTVHEACYRKLKAGRKGDL